MSNPTRSTPEPLPTWQWVAGSLALLLFAQKLVHDWPLGQAASSLWVCHMANLAMGLGLLLRQPWLARLGVYWLLPGLPLWLVDVVTLQTTTLSSVASHAGGAVVAGLIVSCRCWAGRRSDPWAAWAGYLLLQGLARWLTPPALNVNLAHAMHPSASGLFGSHAAYLAFLAAAAAAGLLLLHLAIEAVKRRAAAVHGGRSTGTA